MLNQLFKWWRAKRDNRIPMPLFCSDCGHQLKVTRQYGFDKESGQKYLSGFFYECPNPTKRVAHPNFLREIVY